MDQGRPWVCTSKSSPHGEAEYLALLLFADRAWLFPINNRMAFRTVDTDLYIATHNETQHGSPFSALECDALGCFFVVP